MDAGIIVAVKKHYHRKQLAYAVDEADTGRNPYTVTQLQAMRWIIEWWNDLYQLVFVNCYRYRLSFTFNISALPRVSKNL